MIQLIRKNLKQIKKDLVLRQFKKQLRPFFEGKNGIEIGGPTELFSRDLPLYRLAKNIDGCNFSTYTIWEGFVREGANYNYYPDKSGYQYINEASDLKGIETGKYDFLLASHCLEHCANPLKTVQEWLRVTRPGGCLFLILPDKRYTFDNKRPITSFKHLLEDYNNDTGENDLTHLDEILELHDLAMDKPAGNREAFKKRSLQNFENRCLHHHVFDFKLLEEIYGFFKIDILITRFVRPCHQIIVGTKNDR